MNMNLWTFCKTRDGSLRATNGPLYLVFAPDGSVEYANQGTQETFAKVRAEARRRGVVAA